MGDRTEAEPKVVLVVDDDLPLLEFLRQALEPEGFTVLAASNPFVAVRLAAMNQPHVIIMDLDMPGMEGVETAKHLRKIDQTREIPVIAFTGQPASLPEDLQVCGFASVVLKADGVEALQRQIEEIFSSRSRTAAD